MVRISSPLELGAWIAGLGLVALYKRDLHPRRYAITRQPTRRVDALSLASHFKSLPLTPSSR